MVDKNNPAVEVRELIARLCAERNEDFATLSRLIGRNSAYVQQFVRRGTPRRLPERERRILARHFGVAESLLGADAEEGSAVGFSVLPALEQDGAEEAVTGLAFAADWLTGLVPDGVERVRRHVVRGDVMAPTLNPGDELLVDIALDPGFMPDGLYVLRIDGATQVRRLMFHPARDEVTVQADNPAYRDWPGIEPGTLDLVGRVIWAGRRLF